MSRIIRVSDLVYEALEQLKPYPSVSFNDIILDLLEEVEPDLIADLSEDFENRVG